MEEKRITVYNAWFNDVPGYTSPGSFQKALFQAYKIADKENKTRLERGFPALFVTKTVTPPNE